MRSAKTFLVIANRGIRLREALRNDIMDRGYAS